MSSSQNEFHRKTTSGFNATFVLGDKWSPCLLFALTQQPMRFNQLQEHLYNINPRTLSQRLMKLESMGIILKKTLSQNPPHTEYSLTEKGRELIPILKSMIKWGDKYSDVKNNFYWRGG